MPNALARWVARWRPQRQGGALAATHGTQQRVTSPEHAQFLGLALLISLLLFLTIWWRCSKQRSRSRPSLHAAFHRAHEQAFGVDDTGADGKEITQVELTAVQQLSLQNVCDGMVEEARDLISKDADKHEWVPHGTVNGAEIHLARHEGSAVKMVKGEVDVQIEESDLAFLAAGLCSALTREQMARKIGQVDPSLMDCDVLATVHYDPDTPTLTQLEWAVFSAPPPLAPRDMLWVAHQRLTRARDGRRMLVSLNASVENDALCADKALSHGYVRAQLFTSGSIFKETEVSGVWRIVYVVRLDPKGNIPLWVVNLVAAKQGGNAGTLKTRLLERKRARSMLASLPTWESVEVCQALIGGPIGREPIVRLGKLSAKSVVEWRMWVPDNYSVGCELLKLDDDGCVGEHAAKHVAKHAKDAFRDAVKGAATGSDTGAADGAGHEVAALAAKGLARGAHMHTGSEGLRVSAAVAEEEGEHALGLYESRALSWLTSPRILVYYQVRVSPPATA